MADLQFSTADQVLINAAQLISSLRLWPEEKVALALDCAAEVIGKGNPDNPLMEPIVECLRALINAPKPIMPAQNAWTMMRLADALAKLAEWRLGQALEHHRSKQGAAA